LPKNGRKKDSTKGERIDARKAPISSDNVKDIRKGIQKKRKPLLAPAKEGCSPRHRPKKTRAKRWDANMEEPEDCGSRLLRKQESVGKKLQIRQGTSLFKREQIQEGGGKGNDMKREPEPEEERREIGGGRGRFPACRMSVGTKTNPEKWRRTGEEHC